MKMRKLDQILEQCLEDMELNETKFDFKTLNKLCEDAEEHEDNEYEYPSEDEEEAELVIQQYEEDILDRKDLMSEKEEAAKNSGYQMYDNSLVINVKGRPDITNEQVIEYLNTPEGEDAYQLAIQDFINILDKYEIDNFVTEGRMSGYWGISEFGLEISNEEYLVQKLLEKAKQDPDYENIRELGNLNGFLQDILYNNIDEFAEEAELSVRSEDLNTMKRLSELIDKQEEEMNKPEFWNL